MYIKDWFKPVFLLFVNRLFDWTLNTRGRICTHTTLSFTRMVEGTSA